MAQEVTVGYVGSMASEYVDDGVPFLRSLNVRPHRVSVDDIRYISPGFHQRIAKSALAPGDVVTVRTGKPGATAVVPEWLPVANCSDLVVTRPGPSLDSRWLSYYINGAANAYVSSRLVGAVQQHFNVGAAKELMLNLPPLEEQREIAATLGALDDKIESNRRVVDTAAQLAVTLLLVQDATGLAEKVRVGDVAELNKGLSYKGAGLTSSDDSSALPLINLKSFSTGPLMNRDGLKYYRGEYKDRHIVRSGDLMVANTDLTQAREILGRSFLVPTELEGAIHTHHTSVLRFLDRPELRYVFWAQSRTQEFRDRAEGYATGTTVSALPPVAVLDYELEVPVNLAAKRGQVEALLERVWQIEREIDSLTRLREALLPELLSGRIRVPEAAEAVEEAVS
ncbi:restriction endonuclease subunit S [Nesterenkonia lacusekhoensis]|uniref:Type I restriction enzyme S subunit n=1 Tax=Nesterenkonia lacusekhoensis TaxID=150832 RepID=A0ABS4T4Y6_9MICC|nr:type I restriction enzyme S subunit [Nesterenkonia lacusekhoensis]